MHATILLALLLLGTSATVHCLDPCLYPHPSESRDVLSLDGLWNFVPANTSDPLAGVREHWHEDDLARNRHVIRMPVPASYNDITTDARLRDHVGLVWYDRRFFVPRAWSGGQRVWLRFGSVHYAAQVWVNGRPVMTHHIGHLPFQADVTDALRFDRENRVTVQCDNTLAEATLPQGEYGPVPAGFYDNETVWEQTYTFDFFNYAGIHRSVQLYTTPRVYIRSVLVNTTYRRHDGMVHFRVEASENISGANFEKAADDLSLAVRVLDRNGDPVAAIQINGTLTGLIVVPDVRLWWPYLMDAEPGYLYTLELTLLSAGEQTSDVYRTRIGIRQLRWTDRQVLLNDRPIYFRGFGRHEDADVRGKGLDLALLARDFQLMRWTGANAYRTSHYPYSEESLQMADEMGVMVIAECPAVDVDGFGEELLQTHKRAMLEMVMRDRNHASVIMWSISNEARCTKSAAGAYFEEVASYTRSLDALRPLTAASNALASDDLQAQYLDVIGFNRYNAWYHNTGRLDVITSQVLDEAREWNAKYNKPVIMFEYGADAVDGLHALPSMVWSEDYQRETFEQHFRAFDQLRQLDFFVGEFIWNFADFMTSQKVNRVVGNRKGIFTRQRQPKAAAWVVRKRYHALAKSDGNFTVLN